jgi:tetratricopeptide (TPR) repeat protein
MGELDRSRFQAAMDLADRAMDLPDAEKEAVLLEYPDVEVRQAAKKLLDADARAGDFMSTPALRRVPSALEELRADSLSGMRVGPFRLVSLLGKGGMGEVWVGVREGADFEQRVAVKLLHTGGDADALARRFKRERQILARFEHPGIARLLDGGVSEHGQPWLAMELVDGLPLTEHSVARELGTDERLGLFLQVCDAVQFAHRNLVVHRDLKPGNILVTPSGDVKLLDFGIAKLLLDEDEHETALTQTGERPMTPDYAAPEQVRGGTVTTATDVWALGVILHELLTGVRPYRSESKNRVEVERAILEAVPSRPSSQGVLTKALRSRLKGDLDAIVLKALRREPENRYPSAEALAADVRRHMSGLPVAARGDATGYVLRSFMRRYRVGVGFSALVFVALLVGIAGTLWQAHRAREQAQKAERTQEFLVRMLEEFDPNQQGGKPVTQRDLLSRGESRLRELDGQPDVQARLLRVFAQTWMNIGDIGRAKEAAVQALAMERALGPGRLEVAKALVILAKCGDIENDLAATERNYTEALSVAKSSEGPEGATALAAKSGVALVARRHGDFPESERLYRQVLETYTRLRGPEHVDTIDIMGALGLPLLDEGRFEESAELFRRASALSAKVLGENHPETLVVRANLARALMEMGRPAEADAILRDVCARQAEVVGEDAPYAIYAKFVRAGALDDMGRPQEALPILERSIRAISEAAGPESVGLATSLARESVVLRHLRRLDEAEAAARRAVSIQAPRLGENHTTARSRSALGSALLAQGKLEEARTELSRALAVQERLLLPDHPDLRATRAELARAQAPTSP